MYIKALQNFKWSYHEYIENEVIEYKKGELYEIPYLFEYNEIVRSKYGEEFLPELYGAMRQYSINNKGTYRQQIRKKFKKLHKALNLKNPEKVFIERFADIGISELSTFINMYDHYDKSNIKLCKSQLDKLTLLIHKIQMIIFDQKIRK